MRPWVVVSVCYRRHFKTFIVVSVKGISIREIQETIAVQIRNNQRVGRIKGGPLSKIQRIAKTTIAVPKMNCEIAGWILRHR